MQYPLHTHTHKTTLFTSGRLWVREVVGKGHSLEGPLALFEKGVHIPGKVCPKNLEGVSAPSRFSMKAPIFRKASFLAGSACSFFTSSTLICSCNALWEKSSNTTAMFSVFLEDIRVGRGCDEDGEEE